MLYGGGISGGKSILLLGMINQLCINYPGTRYAVIRKNLTTLKRTSIPSFKKVLELNKYAVGSVQKDYSELVKFNMADYTAKYVNGSEVLFMEADKTKDPDFNKFKGIEITMAVFEEANEIDQEVFSLTITRVGRWKNADYGLKPMIFLNCNPAKNWVKKLFYEPWSEGTIKTPYFFLPALPNDNPHNTKEYLDSLKNLPYAEYQRYVKGNWDFSDDPDQLIQYQWLKDCKNLELSNWVWDRRDNQIHSLGVDVARYGDDRTVLAFFSFARLVKIEVFSKKSTTEVARIVYDRAEEYEIKPDSIGVDVVGLGAGTVDSLRDLGLHAYAYNSGNVPDATPNKFNRYKNKRAQAFWELREDLSKQEIEIIDHKDLINECVSINYSIDNKVILIESKDSYKKRHSSSPDILDAVVIGNYMRKRGTISFKKIYNNMTEIPDTSVGLLDSL